MIFAGIEGGATHSKLILVKITAEGKIEKLFEEEGQSLNCVILGAEFTCDYISKWIKSATQKLELILPIEGVGLGLAGAGNTEITQKITELFHSKYANVVTNCYVTTDAIAAIATAFKNGGVVLISGTGSACRYLSNSGAIFGTGGNGHLIEERGGGFWIAQKAVQTIFNHEECLELSDYPIEFLKTLIMDYFKLKEFRDILNVFYGPNFSKAKIASFCRVIAENADKDPLCELLFEKAGEALAQNLVAISRNFDDKMFENVSILLVGSVFQSWKLLKIGFVKTLHKKASKIERISFYILKESAAMGAAILATKTLNIHLNFDFKTTELIDTIVLTQT